MLDQTRVIHAIEEKRDQLEVISIATSASSAHAG